jgi:uncharacterized membrane protein
MKRVLLSVAVALIAGTACAQTPPPPPCGPADQVIGLLGQMFGERPFLRGRNAAGVETVLLMSPATRTWTLLVTRDGIACMAMAGAGMVPAERPPDPGNPS